MNQTDLQQYINDLNQQVETSMTSELEQSLVGCDPLLKEILRHALFSGGKRIRPILTILGSKACGMDNSNLYLLAVGLEYLHVATLIHDDVIDHAKQRRGQASVVDKYGMAAAILTGDWLHARAMFLVAKMTGSKGLQVFCRATAAMVDGEFTQLHHCGNPDIQESDYFKIIDKKTAGLISSACALGAIYANAEQDKITALASYGYNLGISFQIIDDLLDYQGKSTTTGKQTGNDFAEGKITLPLILAMKENSMSKKTISSLIKEKHKEGQTLQKLYQEVEKAGCFAKAREEAEKFGHKAMDNLSVFSPTKEKKAIAALHGLVGFVLERNK